MRWRYAALQISVRFCILYEIEHITDTCYLSIPSYEKKVRFDSITRIRYAPSNGAEEAMGRRHAGEVP